MAQVPAPNPMIQEILEQDEIIVQNYALNTNYLHAVYDRRGHAPLWSFTDNSDILALQDFVRSAQAIISYHGLRAQDYPIKIILRLSRETDPESKAMLDILVTDMILRIGQNLHGDNINIKSVYPSWAFTRPAVDIAGTFNQYISANNIQGFMDSLTPRNPSYGLLIKALAKYRAIANQGGWPVIDEGSRLTQGRHSDRTPQLRRRLVAEGYVLQPNMGDKEFFSEDVENALKLYQSQNGIEAHGMLDDTTLAALNIPVGQRINQIIANIERMRHFQEDVPARYAEVNIPNAMLTVREGDKKLFNSRVIVGRTTRKTPFINSTITQITINPSWYVPMNIAREDILPKLQSNPDYLEERGIVIDAEPKDIYGKKIKWEEMDKEDFNVRLRQKPGEENDLGRIKFSFDNRYQVYLHGTPHQSLFEETSRNFSSGCVRVRWPLQFAQILLETNAENWGETQIQTQIDSQKTQSVNLDQAMPIRITYWTAYTGSDGQINFRPDVYGYDRDILIALKRIKPVAPEES